MPWNTSEIETKLKNTLNSFEWSEAANIVGKLIDDISKSKEPYPEDSAKTLLSRLRGKQCFDLMSSLAGAFISSGANYLQIRRQYAQSLIDRGILSAEPETVLHSVIEDSKNHETPKIKRENFEARGLLGRMYKQMYINSETPNANILQKAFDAYHDVYKQEKSEIWHGINAVALIKRAQRDDIELEGAPNPNILAAQIIEFIDEKEKKEKERRENLSDEELEMCSEETLPQWDIATKIEALIATGDYKPAEKLAFRYVEHDGSDAFELNSTLRQLREVWKLAEENSPGSNILSIISTAHLQKRGASAIIETKNVEDEQKRIQQSLDELQAMFGTARTQSLLWVVNMYERSKSVAKFKKLNGAGHGTGLLVNGGDFFPGMDGQLMVLTNFHVISDPPHPKAVTPDKAFVHFEVTGETFNIKRIYWSSPVEELDATFLLLDGQPTAKPLPMFNDNVIFGTPPPTTLFVIGHPGGGDLAFSLEDNLLIATNDKYIHYRTPTKPGSSGSPVFDDVGWEVVALHHAGSPSLKRLDNPFVRYEANEGIKIRTIKEQTMKFVPPND